MTRCAICREPLHPSWAGVRTTHPLCDTRGRSRQERATVSTVTGKVEAAPAVTAETASALNSRAATSEGAPPA